MFQWRVAIFWILSTLPFHHGNTPRLDFFIAPEHVKLHMANEFEEFWSAALVQSSLCVCLCLTGRDGGKWGKCKRQDSCIGSPIRRCHIQRPTCVYAHACTPTNTCTASDRTRTTYKHTECAHIHNADVHSQTSCGDVKNDVCVWVWVATVVQ